MALSEHSPAQHSPGQRVELVEDLDGPALPDILLLGSEAVGWTGGWPPPKRIWRMTGTITGDVAHCDPDDPVAAEIVAEVVADLPTVPSIVVERFRRVSYSTWPAATAPGPHLARGARYDHEPAAS